MTRLTPAKIRRFQKTILDYYRREGRHDLPWRRTSDPYRILVSEMMLQQTQVPRVIEKYAEFTARFPDVETLAAAPLRDVLEAWSGLGYNRRAKYLKQTAEIVVERHGGALPSGVGELETLPGIGPTTARAIAAFAFGEAHPFIETNIRSVYIHFFFGNEGRVPDSELLPHVRATLPKDNAREWYNALMDYGVMLKARFGNPSKRSAHHAAQSKFEGSNRQVRGAIIRALTGRRMTERELKDSTGFTLKRLRPALSDLEREGMIVRVRGKISIA